MSRLTWTATILFGAFTTNCVAQDQPFAVSNLGGVASFRSDSYIKAAAKLQSFGKEKGIKALQDVSESDGRDEAIIMLCRMVFKAKGKKEFRRPFLGLPHFVGPSPSEPIVIVDGVPFSVVKGYSLKGFPEQAESYVKYCIDECEWNTYQFKEKSGEEKRKALNKYLSSWEFRPNASQLEFLEAQIK